MVSKLQTLVWFSLSGLNLAPVARLRSSWEKLPSKYEKLFGDLQDVFDPSRNMAKYRNILSSQSMQPPIIPLFPVVKKDLTFLHEGSELRYSSPILTNSYFWIGLNEWMSHSASLFFSPPGNDSSVDGLVNFEKLRMIAKEIRHVVRLTSVNMDPALMFRQRWIDVPGPGSAVFIIQQCPFKFPKGGGATGKMANRSLRKRV